MKILIFGLPGSGKTTLAKPLANLLGGVHINADDVRTRYNDWDFSIKARIEQAKRMLHLADGVVLADRIAVIDFVCPLAKTRDLISADYTVFMDTIKESQYKDTNIIFQKPDPQEINYHVNTWFDDTHQQLGKVVLNYMLKQQGKQTERL